MSKAVTIFEFLLVAVLSLLATPIHLLLLLNPFWFRKNLLDRFRRTHWFHYMSAFNWDWGTLFGWL